MQPADNTPADSTSPPAAAPRPAWGVIFAVWSIPLLLEMVQGEPAPGGPDPWSWQRVSLGLLTWYPWALVTPRVFALARRQPLRPPGLWRAGAWHLALAVGFAGLYLSVLVWADHLLELGWATQLGGQETLALRWRRVLATGLPPCLVIYGIVVSVGHGLDLRRRFQRQTLEASRLATRSATLERQLAEAQLQALRMQLQPHFLFNTLNAISALISADPEGAQAMVARLGDLLRATLDGGHRREVSLAEEVALLERYLDIERIRFGPRLAVRYTLDSAVLEARVPMLILQPLVENAVRHGIGPQTAGGMIHVAARREGDALRLEVRDDGVGLPTGVRREGIGLSNTRARLTQRYGERGPLHLSPGPEGGTRVRLTLPWSTAPPAGATGEGDEAAA